MKQRVFKKQINRSIRNNDLSDKRFFKHGNKRNKTMIFKGFKLIFSKKGVNYATSEI